MARVGQIVSPRFVGRAEEESNIQTDRDARHPRSSIILTTTHWLRRGKYISLYINPQSTQWSLPRRETVTKTAAGTIRNTWRNRYRNTYYDEFEVSFTFQTGSLLPSSSIPSNVYRDPALIGQYTTRPNPPRGLRDFYRFLSMVDQPLLMGQAENRHIVLYRSRLFPKLQMTGYWLGTTPIAFTDDGTDGNKATWTATFQCYRTYPSLWNWRGEQLSAAWQQWATANPQELFDENAMARARQLTNIDEFVRDIVGAPDPASVLPPNPPDPDAATKIKGKRANTGTKTIGLVTGDVQPGTKFDTQPGVNPNSVQPTTGAGAGKRVVSPTNTPQQVTTTVNSTNTPVQVTSTTND